MIRPAHPGDAEIVRTLVHEAYPLWVSRLGRVSGPM
jgi:hypothetical protein